MKAVMLSVQPKWCELIASGKKTVEVRKTKPKLEKPFKCYIYETKGKTETPSFIDEDGHVFFRGEGKVIGEFVCDGITSLKANNFIQTYYNSIHATCLTDVEIMKYANGGKLYYWHISNLKIYDEPKELRQFKRALKNNTHKEWLKHDSMYLQRPPQSWCYVEEKRVEV